MLEPNGDFKSVGIGMRPSKLELTRCYWVPKALNMMEPWGFDGWIPHSHSCPIPSGTHPHNSCYTQCKIGDSIGLYFKIQRLGSDSTNFRKSHTSLDFRRVETALPYFARWWSLVTTWRLPLPSPGRISAGLKIPLGHWGLRRFNRDIEMETHSCYLIGGLEHDFYFSIYWG